MRHKVARLSDLPEEAGSLVEIDGREIALFREGARVHALDAVCPHRGASLAFGEVRGGVVHCPLHAWPFRLADGRCTDPRPAGESAVKVEAFPVTLEGEDVYLEL
jgi:nitrite reductase (NADH) small subunit